MLQNITTLDALQEYLFDLSTVPDTLVLPSEQYAALVKDFGPPPPGVIPDYSTFKLENHDPERGALWCVEVHPEAP